MSSGRAVIPAINYLLGLPFAVKIATKDWHPVGHISFASSHAGKKPFVDYATITNPLNPQETYSSRLWPDHCIENTPGAELVSELEVGKINLVIEKGQVKDVEMYSAFYPPLENPRVGDSGLASALRKRGISDVYVVGLAADYCVKETALHALGEGFQTYIVEEGTKPVDVELWNGVQEKIREVGVQVVALEGDEVRRVKEGR